MPNALGHHAMKNAADNMILQHTTFISYIFTVHVLTNYFFLPVAVAQQCTGENTVINFMAVMMMMMMIVKKYTVFT